jgi:pimeloyl-ACP methyl ester carboxylesterase
MIRKCSPVAWLAVVTTFLASCLFVAPCAWALQPLGLFDMGLGTGTDPSTTTDGAVRSIQPLPSEGQVVVLATSTVNMGVYRFRTQEEWYSFDLWFGTGGHPLSETGGKVYTSDYSVGLLIHSYGTEDETILTMRFRRPDSSVAITDSIRYDLDEDTWYDDTPYGWQPIAIGDPEDPYWMDVAWIEAKQIQATDPVGIWTIEFLVNGFLTYSEQFELVPAPTILKARMVKDTVNGVPVLGLGVDLNVGFPPTDNAEQRRFVRLSATVNGVPVSQEFDITALVGAGEPAKDIRFNEGTDPSVEKRIMDFAAAFVPKFQKHETFTLTAEACTSDGLCVPSQPVEVEIYLPVVIVHGYLLPTSRKLLYGTVIAEGVYTSLERYLTAETSGPFTTGYTTDPTWYRTLWRGGWNFSSSYDTLAHWLDGWVSDALDATYAERVNIIGHSFGGLIARYYVSDPDDLVPDAASRVHKLVMIGTPNSGATLFYTVTDDKSRTEVEDWRTREPITLWGLPRYVDSLGASIACLYERGTLTPIWPDPLVVRPELHGADGSLLTYPEGWPDVLVRPVGVTYYSIYRDNIPTDYLLWATPTRENWYSFTRKSGKDTMPQEGGDGMVPAVSAVLPTAIPIPLSVAKPSSHYTKLFLSHGLLPSNGDVQAAVLGVLREEE